jgi:hypothetical protein
VSAGKAGVGVHVSEANHIIPKEQPGACQISQPRSAKQPLGMVADLTQPQASCYLAVALATFFVASHGVVLPYGMHANGHTCPRVRRPACGCRHDQHAARRSRACACRTCIHLLKQNANRAKARTHAHANMYRWTTTKRKQSIKACKQIAGMRMQHADIYQTKT